MSIRINGRPCKTLDEIERDCAGGAIVHANPHKVMLKQVGAEFKAWRNRRFRVSHHADSTGRVWTLLNTDKATAALPGLHTSIPKGAGITGTATSAVAAGLSPENLLLPNRAGIMLVTPPAAAHTSRSNSWTVEEDAVLDRLYPVGGAPAVHAALNGGRSVNAIHFRANQRFLHRVAVPESWSRSEIDILRRFFPCSGLHVTADHLPGKSVNAVRKKARELGLSRKAVMNTWTDQELTLLALHYGTRGAAFCKERLPLRSIQSILRKAAEMGLCAPLDRSRSRRDIAV